MFALWIYVLHAHVPTYGGGIEQCFTPPHHHDISQVVYIKGSGGLEVHIESQTDPFDILGNEILDVDAVFKQEYDQSTYSLYVGCGGCVATQDPIVIAPVQLDGYEPAVIEPFTQVRASAIRPRIPVIDAVIPFPGRRATARSFPRLSGRTTRRAFAPTSVIRGILRSDWCAHACTSTPFAHL